MRNESLIVKHSSRLDVRLVAKSPRHAPPWLTPSLRIAGSPRTLLSLGSVVVLLRIFAFFASGILSENRANPTLSSDRSHKWRSKTVLVAIPMSRSIVWYLSKFVHSARSFPSATAAREASVHAFVYRSAQN